MRRIILAVLWAGLAGILGGRVPIYALSPASNPTTPAPESQPAAPEQTGTPPSPAPATASDEGLPGFQETVVVTSSLRVESTQDTTATVDVITAADIAARQATSVSEVLATVPGVSVAQSGSPGHATSTFTRGAESYQTLVLWNGIPLNDPILGGFDWAFLPTEGVSRVEVVRGPYSALYGSSAIGGVVQVLTGGEQGGTADLAGGSDSYRQARVAAGYDLGPVRLDVSGHLRRGDGQFRNDFYDSNEGLARADWKIAPGTDLGLLVRTNDSNIGIPFSGAEASPFRRSNWQETEVAVPFKTSDGPWQVEALLSEADTRLRFRDPQDPFTTSSDADTQRLRGRAVASYGFGAETWLAGGVEWERQQATSSDNNGVNLDHSRQRNEALFSQFHSAWGPLRLDLGLREDDNQRFGNHLSPDLGVALLAAPGLRLHASYGEGFRSPTLGDLFFPFFGNPNLKPEISRSLEVGADLASGPWRAGVVGFQNRLRDLIQFDILANQEVNVGRARSRGVEAEAGYRSRFFDLQLNGTYLDARDLDTDLQLVRRPQKSANLVATVRPAELWTLNLVERYVGRRFDFDPVTFARTTNAAYARLDLAATWQIRPAFAPFIRIQNATDKSYSEVLGFPAPRRQFIGGVGFHL